MAKIQIKHSAVALSGKDVYMLFSGKSTGPGAKTVENVALQQHLPMVCH